MYTFHLSDTLSESQCPEWEKFAAQSLDPGVHPQRKHSFLLARDALKKCLESLGQSISIQDLNLVDYHYLKSSPDLTISLSHTKTHGAALVAERKIYRAVGIDIEEKTRLVKDSIRARVLHPHDYNLSSIELWCAKEAAFKALMNTGEFNNPMEFSSIQITATNWSHASSGYSGEWKLISSGQILVALAFLKN